MSENIEQFVDLAQYVDTHDNEHCRATPNVHDSDDIGFASPSSPVMNGPGPISAAFGAAMPVPDDAANLPLMTLGRDGSGAGDSVYPEIPDELVDDFQSAVATQRGFGFQHGPDHHTFPSTQSGYAQPNVGDQASYGDQSSYEPQSGLDCQPIHGPQVPLGAHFGFHAQSSFQAQSGFCVQSGYAQSNVGGQSSCISQSSYEYQPIRRPQPPLGAQPTLVAQPAVMAQPAALVAQPATLVAQPGLVVQPALVAQPASATSGTRYPYKSIKGDLSNVQCSVCDNKRSIKSIRKHVERAHPVEFKFYYGKDPTRHSCGHCEKVFTDKGQRDNHEFDVHGEGVHKFSLNFKTIVRARRQVVLSLLNSRARTLNALLDRAQNAKKRLLQLDPTYVMGHGIDLARVAVDQNASHRDTAASLGEVTTRLYKIDSPLEQAVVDLETEASKLESEVAVYD